MSNPEYTSVLAYAKAIGIDLDNEIELIDIAKEALLDLPPGWELCVAEEGDIESMPFFHNSSTGESVWNHPKEHIYLKKLKNERKYLSELNSNRQNQKDTTAKYDRNDDGRNDQRANIKNNKNDSTNSNFRNDDSYNRNMNTSNDDQEELDVEEFDDAFDVPKIAKNNPQFKASKSESHASERSSAGNSKSIFNDGWLENNAAPARKDSTNDWRSSNTKTSNTLMDKLSASAYSNTSQNGALRDGSDNRGRRTNYSGGGDRDRDRDRDDARDDRTGFRSNDASRERDRDGYRDDRLGYDAGTINNNNTASSNLLSATSLTGNNTNMRNNDTKSQTKMYDNYSRASSPEKDRSDAGDRANHGDRDRDRDRGVGGGGGDNRDRERVASLMNTIEDMNGEIRSLNDAINSSAMTHNREISEIRQKYDVLKISYAQKETELSNEVKIRVALEEMTVDLRSKLHALELSKIQYENNQSIASTPTNIASISLYQLELEKITTRLNDEWTAKYNSLELQLATEKNMNNYLKIQIADQSTKGDTILELRNAVLQQQEKVYTLEKQLLSQKEETHMSSMQSTEGIKRELLDKELQLKACSEDLKRVKDEYTSMANRAASALQQQQVMKAEVDSMKAENNNILSDAHTSHAALMQAMNRITLYENELVKSKAENTLLQSDVDRIQAELLQLKGNTIANLHAYLQYTLYMTHACL